MKETKPWFQTWFNKGEYHTLYGHRDVNEAKVFIDKLDSLFNKEGLTVLDAGCGAGRHVHAWTELGHHATGFDLSPNSIDSAIQTAKANNLDSSFQVLDMRCLHDTPELNEKFDVVTNLFTSFGYFTEEKDHKLVVQGFANSLKAGGMLVMDYLNPEYSKARLVLNESVVKEGVQFEITREFDGEFFKKTIEYTDASGVSHSFTEQVKAWSIEDLNKLLSSVGLQTQSCFGDYNLSPYSEKSPRMIVLAEKIK